MDQTNDIPAGIRAGLPLVLPTLALGVSFGVLAKPVMGSVAPIVMSVIVFSGAAQFAALSVLAAGGGPFAAIVAGLLAAAPRSARWRARCSATRAASAWTGCSSPSTCRCSWAR